MRLALSLRVFAMLRTCIAIFAVKLTLWRTVLFTALISRVCTKMVHTVPAIATAALSYRSDQLRITLSWRGTEPGSR